MNVNMVYMCVCVCVWMSYDSNEEDKKMCWNIYRKIGKNRRKERSGVDQWRRTKKMKCEYRRVQEMFYVHNRSSSSSSFRLLSLMHRSTAFSYEDNDVNINTFWNRTKAMGERNGRGELTFPCQEGNWHSYLRKQNAHVSFRLRPFQLLGLPFLLHLHRLIDLEHYDWLDDRISTLLKNEKSVWENRPFQENFTSEVQFRYVMTNMTSNQERVDLFEQDFSDSWVMN